jgi:large subunit ribosomal protein L18
MDIRKLVDKRRQRRRYSVRKRMHGTAERPRLSIQRSLNHFSCQLIDDSAAKTLVSASSLEKGLRSDFPTAGNCEAAARLGKILAERAQAAGIRAATFDRGHCRYHGRVAAFADAVREGGLDF